MLCFNCLVIYQEIKPKHYNNSFHVVISGTPLTLQYKFICLVSLDETCACGLLYGKKVLRELKRYTARRVASTRCAALSNPDLVWGEYPIPGLGGVPSPRSRGYPIPGPGGTPFQVWVGGGTPDTPPPVPRPGMGYPPYLDLGWGTPLPRPGMGYPPT